MSNLWPLNSEVLASTALEHHCWETGSLKRWLSKRKSVGWPWSCLPVVLMRKNRDTTWHVHTEDSHVQDKGSYLPAPRPWVSTPRVHNTALVWAQVCGIGLQQHQQTHTHFCPSSWVLVTPPVISPSLYSYVLHCRSHLVPSVTHHTISPWQEKEGRLPGL